MKHSSVPLTLLGVVLVIGLAACNQSAPTPLLSPILPAPAATVAEVSSPNSGGGSPLATPSPLATALPTPTPDPKQTPLVITGVEIRQDGHEILKLKNITAETIAFTGYALLNPATGRRFNFPPGFELSGGETATVHSGVGQAAAGEGLFWQAEPVWAGWGEDALLLTPTSALGLLVCLSEIAPLWLCRSGEGLDNT